MKNQQRLSQCSSPEQCQSNFDELIQMQAGYQKLYNDLAAKNRLNGGEGLTIDESIELRQYQKILESIQGELHYSKSQYYRFTGSEKTLDDIYKEILQAGAGIGLGAGSSKNNASGSKQEAGKGANSSGANESTGLLPKPGNNSAPASGVGANSVFKVDNAQLGKKLGKHVEDFGGNPSNAADRQMVLNKIHDIGNNSDKIIAGTFSGQGANGARGDVFFRIKGNDVVVTKPDGTFVTLLKDGVTTNTSVKNALKGNP